MNTLEFQWVEKFRPTTIEDTILPASTKAQFQKFVDDGDFPNLLLTGSAGIGKTTVAKAMIGQIGSDCMMVNCSKETGIATIRDRVSQFVSSVSFTDGRKFVILDEIDGLSPEAQKALKAFIEECSHNAGFIMTSNHIAKVIPPLQSRGAVVDFTIRKEDRAPMAMAFMKRVEVILGQEGVAFERKAVAGLIQKWFPDFRRVINELQRYASGGAIDSGVLAAISETSLDELIGFLKKKDFTATRKWVAENSDISATSLFHRFYDQSSSLFTPGTVPEVVLILAKYGYQSAFAVDQEVNTAAAFVEIMLSAAWKD